MPANANQALSSQIEAFLAFKRHSRRCKSAASREQYANVLCRVLAPWCRSAGFTEAADLTTQPMEGFIAYLEGKRSEKGAALSVASIRTYVRVVRIFLRWAEVPPGRYEVPSEPRRLRNVLSRQEIDVLERAARSQRDKVLIRVLADSGLRISELLGIRDVDLRADTNKRRYLIRVDGKTGPREVGLPHETFFRLQQLAKDRPFAFMGRAGRLTPNGAGQIVRKLGRKLGRELTPHLFRHSFITQQIRSGKMNLVQLQVVVGHSSLQMLSQVYNHLASDDVYDAQMAGLRG